MKNLILLTIIAFVLAGCGNNSSDTPQPKLPPKLPETGYEIIEFSNVDILNDSTLASLAGTKMSIDSFLDINNNLYKYKLILAPNEVRREWSNQTWVYYYNNSGVYFIDKRIGNTAYSKPYMSGSFVYNKTHILFSNNKIYNSNNMNEYIEIPENLLFGNEPQYSVYGDTIIINNMKFISRYN